MLKVSEGYIIGFDISPDDEAVLTVAESTGSRLIHVNTFHGEEAVNLYKRLITPQSND